MSKLIDLDALTNEARIPRVKLFGREIAVRPLTGAAAHRIAVAQASGDSGQSVLAALLGVVESSCPALTPAEVASLSVEQISAIVQLSRGLVADVEASIAEGEEKN